MYTLSRRISSRNITTANFFSERVGAIFRLFFFRCHPLVNRKDGSRLLRFFLVRSRGDRHFSEKFRSAILLGGSLIHENYNRHEVCRLIFSALAFFRSATRVFAGKNYPAYTEKLRARWNKGVYCMDASEFYFATLMRNFFNRLGKPMLFMSKRIGIFVQRDEKIFYEQF